FAGEEAIERCLHSARVAAPARFHRNVLLAVDEKRGRRRQDTRIRSQKTFGRHRLIVAKYLRHRCDRRRWRLLSCACRRVGDERQQNGGYGSLETRCTGSEMTLFTTAHEVDSSVCRVRDANQRSSHGSRRSYAPEFQAQAAW